MDKVDPTTKESHTIMMKKHFNCDEMDCWLGYASEYVGDDLFYPMYLRYNEQFIPSGVTDPIGTVYHAMVGPTDSTKTKHAYYRKWFENWKEYIPDPDKTTDVWDFHKIRLFNLAQIAGIVTADLMTGNGDRLNREFGVDPDEGDEDVEAGKDLVFKSWNHGNLMRTDIKEHTDWQYIVPMDNGVAYCTLFPDLWSIERWRYGFGYSYESKKRLKEFFVLTITLEANAGVLPLPNPKLPDHQMEDLISRMADIMVYSIQKFGMEICGAQTLKELEFAIEKLGKSIPHGIPDLVYTFVHTNFEICNEKLAALRTKLSAADEKSFGSIVWSMTLEAYFNKFIDGGDTAAVYGDYGDTVDNDRHPAFHVHSRHHYHENRLDHSLSLPYGSYGYANEHYENGEYQNGLLIGGVIGGGSIAVLLVVLCVGLALGVLACFGYKQKKELDERNEQNWRQEDNAQPV
eukprot:944521_1